MIVYIAGPVSGIALNNRPAFLSARATMEQRGFACIIPHELYTPSSSPCPALIWCEAMLRCIPALESSDAVYFLDGWERSPGARRERSIAIDKNIQILKAGG